jgi:predicted ATP-grasp superfamily ATP-dependent carboligase
VVLVGLDSLQGLQAARILHGCGIPVIAVAADHRHPACRTNVCEQVVIADTRGPELLETLHNLGSKLSQEVLLVPCQDKSVRAVSRNRDTLSKIFTFVLPPPDVVELLMDKDAFHAHATAQGLPVPRTVDLVAREDAVRAAEELEFPCVIKPRARTREWDEQTKLKVFKVDSPASLLQTFDRCRPWAEGLIAQQWIDGGDDSLYSCNCYFDRDSRPLATFVARKLRQWPPDAGSSCLGEEVRNDQVLETALSLFGGLSYQGLGYLEMKCDARSGRHYVIEPNVGRPTGRSAIAEAGGIPLLYTMYCDAMGLPLPREATQRYSGAKWVYLRHDLQSAFVYWRRGELSLRDWIRSLQGRKAYAMLSRSDPAPFLADLWRAFLMAGRRVLSRLRPD